MQMKKFINDPDNLTSELLEGLAMANPDILELGEDNMVINKKLADAESKVIFGGRLGEYKYYDMDKVIEVDLDVAAKELA